MNGFNIVYLHLIYILSSFGLGKDQYFHEEKWISRVKIPEFSLGPAPFPDHSQMDWELFGDAFSRSSSIELTKAKQHQKGAVWSKKKNLKYARHFQAEVNFRVGGGPSEADRFGDGFALWYTAKRGIGGDALGGPDTWVGLGIFFDTYKNVHFKTKRHPYVYGLVNNGKININKLTTQDIKYQGCHIPFRGNDANRLDETVARITYKDRTVSVIMQPLGAVDWVKCFEIKNVDLPVGGYFGMTSMTGDLVDEHHMVKFGLYTNVVHQPFSYAHDNDIRQMPQMWSEMRESGREAREFEELRYQEDDLGDDLDFDPAYYHYDDEYDEDYYGEEDYYDQYYGEDEDYSDSRHATKQKHQTQTTHRLNLDPAKEIARMKKKYENSPLFTELIEAVEERDEKILKMQKHMEAEVRQMSDRISSAFKRIRHKESELNMRIHRLGSKLHIQVVNPFKKDLAKQGGGWFWPFFFVFVGLIGYATFGFTKYKKFMKTHLL